MNKDTVSGDWKTLKGKIKSAWGKLSDDELETVKGDFSKLEGQIQKAYGISKEEAAKKFSEFKKSLGSSYREEPMSSSKSSPSDMNSPKPKKPDTHH